MISRFYSSVAVGITMFAFHCNKNLEVIVVSSAGTVTRGCMYAVYMNYISYPKKKQADLHRLFSRKAQSSQIVATCAKKVLSLAWQCLSFEHLCQH